MSGRKVTKGTFALHIRQAAGDGESGMFNIVTDAERSVLLRLSNGHITSSRCRGREIDRAIAVLVATATVRFSFTRTEAEDHPPLIGIDEFLLRIGATDDPGSDTRPRPTRGTDAPRAAAAPRAREDDSFRATLEELAVDIIGPVAQIVVDEAVANNATVKGAIEEIARSIPDAQAAAQFLEAARDRIPDISEEP